MENYKDYIEILEKFEKVEGILERLKMYNKTRGGGILWILCYWPLYIVFLHEIIVVKGKIDNFLDIMGILFFLVVGLFLNFGVIRQINLLRFYHRLQITDYEKILEFLNKHNEAISNNSEIMSTAKDLSDMILSFRKEYFPKKSD